MDDAWENVDVATSIISKRVIQNDDEVKDSWMDIEDDVPPEPLPETSTIPKETKKVSTANKIKTKAKAKDETIPIVENKKLTVQELEEIQRKTEFEHLKDTFGIEGITEEPNAAQTTLSSFEADITEKPKEAKTTLSSLEPTTKEDFKAYCQFLVGKINIHYKKKAYYDFLSDLFRTLSLDLDSEHVRRYSKELNILASEMQKREKENEKQKQPKSSKKPAIVVGKRAILDDIADAGEAFYGGSDDEDFM